MVFDVGLLWGALAHQPLGQVEEVLPKGDQSCPVCRYYVLLWYPAPFVQHPPKVVISPLIFPPIVDGQIDLIVDLPTPPIIIHRTKVQVPPVSHIDLRVQQPLLGLVDVDALVDESLEEERVEDVLEDRLVPLPRGQYLRRHSPLDGIDHRPVESEHGVVVRIDDLDLLFCLADHLDHTVLHLVLPGLLIIMQQLVLPPLIEFRVGVTPLQPLHQGLVGVLDVEIVAVLFGRVFEVLAVLVQCDVLGQVVQVLVLTCTVPDSSVAAFDVGRPYQSVGVGNYQFLVMSSPDIFVYVAFDGTQSPLRVEQQKAATTGLQLLDELSFGPELHIVHKEHHMHSSLSCLYKFDEGCVCSWGGVYGVGGYPKVIFTPINHLPHLFEKLVAFGDELSVGEPGYRLEFK